MFPKLRNWTANNRATSVGNQLHTNYRKFLLAYELAHRTMDLGASAQAPLPAGKARGLLTSILHLMSSGVSHFASEAAPHPPTFQSCHKLLCLPALVKISGLNIFELAPRPNEVQHCTESRQMPTQRCHPHKPTPMRAWFCTSSHRKACASLHRMEAH